MTGVGVTTVLDGKAVSARLREEMTGEIAALRRGGVVPTLAIVVATDDPSSAWYVRALTRAASGVDLAVEQVDLGPEATGEQIGAALDRLAADSGVHGVLLQTPLPKGVHLHTLTARIPPEKDVDGVNPLSAGRLAAGLPAFAPATAAAVLELLDAHQVPLEGARAVVLGRSLIVGKPVAQLLLARNATVTLCHSRTKELATLTRTADVLVAAIGRPRFVGREHVRAGATVVDVGTTPDVEGRLQGDVDAGAVQDLAGALSPVPGGVGPVTTALLLRHTVHAASLAAGVTR